MTERTASNSSDLFDCEAVFCDDYLHFYGPHLSPEFNVQQANVVWRLLSISADCKVLDLGCGHGRIANELARRGARMSGLDSSPFILNVAREAARQEELTVDYVEGDMRELSWRHEFDAIYCWYTTYGYFSDTENIEVLRQCFNALKPGGRLLIEQANRNALLRRGLPFTEVTSRGDDMMIDEVDYDVFEDRTRTRRSMVRQGKVSRANFSIRLYSYAELAARMVRVGFSSAEGFGRGGQPFTTYDPRLILVARK